MASGTFGCNIWQLSVIPIMIPTIRRVLFSCAQSIIPYRFSHQGVNLGVSAQAATLDELATSPIAFETFTHLRKHGYAVLDNYLSDDTCNVLAQEVDKVLRTDYAVANSTHVLEQGTTTKVPKSHVTQAELSTLPRAQLGNYPAMTELHTGVALAAQASVMWPRLTLTEQSVKAQVTTSGGGFPIHVDSAEGQDSRLVTAIIYPRSSDDDAYLNKIGGESGGILRLFPNPVDYVDVRPLKGRLVLFSSRTLHHSVTPHGDPSLNRLSITIWMSGGIRKDGGTLNRDDVSLDDTEQILLKALRPPFRDPLFRIAWEDRWLESFYESHDKTHADRLADAFRAQLDLIRDRLPTALLSNETIAVNVDQLSQLFQSQTVLRDVYAKLRDKLGGRLPFYWT